MEIASILQQPLRPESGRGRAAWQCCFPGDGGCTNPRVTMLTGKVHDFCEEHRVHTIRSQRWLLERQSLSTGDEHRPASPPPQDEEEEDDWAFQPMSGGDWQLSTKDLNTHRSGSARSLAADGVVFGSMFCHGDVGTQVRG